MRDAETETRIKLQRVLRGHQGLIYRLAWSPSGRYLATPSEDRTVLVWETRSGKVLHTLDHQHEVNSVAWSPDEGRLATCDDARYVSVWSRESGECIQSWDDHSDEVNDVAWSPDGTRIASVSDDKRVLIRNLEEDGATELRGHTQTIWTARWSPDGHWLATGADDETVRLWETETGEQRALRGHTSTVRCVRWFSDSRRLASGARDGTVRIWDIDSPTVPRPLEAHNSIVTSVGVSSDDSLVASKGNDGFVRLWSVEQEALVGEIPESGSPKWGVGVSFHPRQPTLATLGENNRVVRVWDLESDLHEQPPLRSNSAGKVVFISYSHKDEEWLKKLMTMLKPILDDGSFSVWTDTQIKAGDKWKERISHALQSCSVAVLLVSPDFLASPFITDVELPKLLQQASDEEVAIVWIPVRHALYESSGLNGFQAAGDPRNPLASLEQSDQDRLLAQVCRTIAQLK